jgi:hypothetical protein
MKREVSFSRVPGQGGSAIRSWIPYYAHGKELMVSRSTRPLFWLRASKHGDISERGLSHMLELKETHESVAHSDSAPSAARRSKNALYRGSLAQSKHDERVLRDGY